MKELTSPGWIIVKGILFLLLGLLSSALLILDHPASRAIALLLLTIWCFCRFYYFAFYVVEHYVDANYRFSGLLSLVRQVVSKRRP
jgi:hypothetical protein